MTDGLIAKYLYVYLKKKNFIMKMSEKLFALIFDEMQAYNIKNKSMVGQK